MLLSDINSAGEGAARLIKVVNNIKTISNTYTADYQAAIDAARTAFNDPLLTFATMSDAQINGFWLGGFGDTTTVATAKEIGIEWELCVLQVKASADKFINNI